MQYNVEAAEFVVEFRGLKVQCRDVEHVVEVVGALAPTEREVPVPQHAELPRETIEVAHANPIATAVYDVFREEPRWRRPIEVVKTLRKRGVRAKYTNVYAVLRYGDFVKREGKWNVKDAAAT